MIILNGFRTLIIGLNHDQISNRIRDSDGSIILLDNVAVYQLSMNIPKTLRRKGFHKMKIGSGIKKPKLIGSSSLIKVPKMGGLPKLPKLPSLKPPRL